MHATRTERAPEPYYHWESQCGCVGSQPERLDFQQVSCDEATRVANVSHPLAVIASNVLLASELSEKNSSIGRGRFAPPPFGRTSNHYSSDSGSPDMLSERKNRAACVLERAPVLVFSSCSFSTLRDFKCVEWTVVDLPAAGDRRAS